MCKQIEPRVGMGATKHYYSDLQGAKIVQVISDKRIVVEFFKYPSYGDAGEIDVANTPTFSPAKAVFTLRKSGTWREVGTPDKRGECWLTIGKAYSYRCMED